LRRNPFIGCATIGLRFMAGNSQNFHAVEQRSQSCILGVSAWKKKMLEIFICKICGKFVY
jgi:hypothetical protein